jgi:hypothetical protein
MVRLEALGKLKKSNIQKHMLQQFSVGLTPVPETRNQN